MKPIKFLTIALSAALAMLWSCQDDTFTEPGLSVETGDTVNTFAGDEVVINATLSDEAGIKAVKITCADWEIDETIDLSKNAPKVYALNYKFKVPDTAEIGFADKVLTIDVENIGGLHTPKEITVKYLPDTAAPQLTGYQSTISVVFNTEGDSPMNKTFTLTDDRSLKSVAMTIDGIDFSDSKNISGKEYGFTPAAVFTAAGTYNAEMTIFDTSNNKTVLPIAIVVMPEEVEDPIEDWARMNIVNTDEDPADYIVGYYQPMSHDGEYTYSCTFYAPAANTHIAFVPQLNLTDNYIGISPYVSTKLINKNGYAEPITIAEAGYHTVTINISTKAYTIEACTPAGIDNYDTIKTMLCMAGTGLSYGSWVFSPHMTVDANNPLRLNGELDVTATVDSAVELCFATDTTDESEWGWTYTFRPDNSSANLLTGWFLLAEGGSFKFNSLGKGIYYVTFDTGISPIWVTVKPSDNLDTDPPAPDTYTKVALSGDFNSWAENDYLGYSRTLDKYFGYYNISTNLWGLNFLLDGDWYKDTGDGETIASDGTVNIAYDAAATEQTTGEFTFTVDLNTMKYTMTPYAAPATTVALSGNFNSWATTDTLSYDAASGQYFGLHTFDAADTVCFVEGSNWYASDGNGGLTAGNANIAVEAGTYLFTVDLTALTFTVTLQQQ